MRGGIGAGDVGGQGRRAPGHGVDPASLLKPLADSWPTYSGDYTGRRFSALTQVNRTTVKNLTLAWVSRVVTGPGAGGRVRADTPRSSSAVTAQVQVHGAATIKGSILQVDGMLYVTAPDHVWAIDARDGHELWRYFWKTRGGTHIGNRGAAIWRNTLLFETPDNYLVSLDARPATSAGTSRSPTSTSSTSPRPHRSSSTTTCSSAPATTSTCRDSSSRSTRKPASSSGSSTPCR